MANPLLAGLLVAATLLPPQGQQDTVPTELRAAAEELALGRVEEAIKLAERYTLRHGRDPRGFMILGDAHAAHMPTGRFRALESYRQAKQLLPHDPERSEEHTSELQSPCNLVCRLLLEKKKTRPQPPR